MQRDLDVAAALPPDAPEVPAAIARLLRLPQGCIALAPHATLEIVTDCTPTPVPCAAAHALGLIEWQGRWIPLVDPQVLLHSGAPRTAPPRYALVVAWQAAPGGLVEHGALALDALPETVSVADSAGCPLPDQQPESWRGAALACFLHEGAAVPVIDSAALFSPAGDEAGQ